MSDPRQPAARDPSPLPSPFDPSVLESQVEGNAELMAEVIRLFLVEYPRLMGEVERAVAANDTAGLRFAAHRLKGAVVHFGARRAVEAAQVLEEMGAAAKIDSAQDGCRELAAALKELDAALVAYLG
jgi:HPt (histidine-containing phosphotransfer) domain-containing protein